MDEQAFQLLMAKMSEQDRKFESIGAKIDELLSFKWKIIGGSVVLSGLLSFAISVLNKI